MKILVISNLYPPHTIGGYEIRCRDTVNYLREHGHNVKVLTSHYGLDKSCTDGHINRILNHHINKPQNRFNDFPFNLFVHKDTKVLSQLIQNFKPDIIYVFNLHGLSKQLLPEILSSPFQVVFDFGDEWLVQWKRHSNFVLNQWEQKAKGPFSNVIKKRIYKIIKRRIAIDWDKIKNKTKAIFISRANLEIFEDEGISFLSQQVIYSGVNVEHFDRINKLPRNDKKIKLIFVGQVEEHKGLHVLLEALKKLIEDSKDYDFHLDVIGASATNSYKENLDSFIERNAMSAHVRFYGNIKRSRIARLLSQNDIFIFTSLYQEGLGRTILEAMSCGLAVIGNVVGGSRELLLDGQNCLTYEVGDSQNLYKKIIQLVKDVPLRRRISKEARKFVVENFQLNERLKEKENLLKDWAKQ